MKHLLWRFECRRAFRMAAYVASIREVMEYMVKKVKELGGQMLQAEDRASTACTMAIGASYGGARAFTAHFRMELSLMAVLAWQRWLGDTAQIIIHSQRGGPSTGYTPTKHEQSDLFAAIYNTHGDTAKMFLSPSTIEEAFCDTFEAFNLAEEYQCPVIRCQICSYRWQLRRCPY